MLVYSADVPFNFGCFLKSFPVFCSSLLRIISRAISARTFKNGGVLFTAWAWLLIRMVDNAIHRINSYPLDSAVCFGNTYPMDSDISGG